MLEGLGGTLDVIVPRGGKSLVERVQREARVPVFAHLEGIVHVYVDRAADLDKAVKIVVNAKMRRTGVCGAAETLLVHRDGRRLPCSQPLIEALIVAGCEVRGDAAAQAADAPGEAGDRGGLADRISRRDHLGPGRRQPRSGDRPYRDLRVASHRLHRHRGQGGGGRNSSKEVDSAIVLHNASTQFADGGEFGFGAEIGIATGRMHARGPVGVEQLCTFKYRVHGDGQTRP